MGGTLRVRIDAKRLYGAHLEASDADGAVDSSGLTIRLPLDSLEPLRSYHLRSTLTWTSSGLPCRDQVLWFIDDSPPPLTLRFRRYFPPASEPALSLELLPFRPSSVPLPLLPLRYCALAFFQLLEPSSPAYQPISSIFAATSDPPIDPLTVLFSPQDVESFVARELSITEIAETFVLFCRQSRKIIHTPPVDSSFSGIHAAILRTRPIPTLLMRFRFRSGDNVCFRVRDNDVSTIPGMVEAAVAGPRALLICGEPREGRQRYPTPRPNRPVAIYHLDPESRVPVPGGRTDLRAYLFAQKPDVVLPYDPKTMPLPWAEALSYDDNSFLAMSLAENAPKGPHQVVWVAGDEGHRPVLIRRTRALSRTDVLEALHCPEAEWEIAQWRPETGGFIPWNKPELEFAPYLVRRRNA